MASAAASARTNAVRKGRRRDFTRAEDRVAERAEDRVAKYTKAFAAEGLESLLAALSTPICGSRSVLDGMLRVR